MLLGAERLPRALIRAQLIEEGLEVVATNTWPSMRCHLQPGSKPRLAIVDLESLSNPGEVLADLRVMMEPGRVLVLAATATVPPEDIDRLGFRRLSRPFAIGDIVKTATTLIGAGNQRSNDSIREASERRIR